jgi:hypothetical protein
MFILTDKQIDSFMSETKIIPKNFDPKLRDKGLNLEFSQEVIGEEGNNFRIIVRQNKSSPLDFSVIFGVILGGKLFRLRRYNGDHGIHTNKIEDEEIDGFHIHKATQRYQERGFREEGFAEKTEKYSDWKSALNKLIKDCNFTLQVELGQSRLI